VAVVEAAYQQLGIRATYINCDVQPDGLGDAVRGARAMGWAGFNCSLPHKVSVIAHLDELADSAAIIGAVNCVVRRGDKLVGENTDGQGFLFSLRSVVEPAGRRLVLFGAGGAARAIAVETALAGAAHITVVNRNAERGHELTQLIRERTAASASYSPWREAFRIEESTTIVVNATSVGLDPDIDRRLDIDIESLHSGMVVADVIPNPPLTWLLRDAAARGCITVDGLGMLIRQAAIAIEHWTGGSPDTSIMRSALLDALAR
jgi:shikimate dehydrogenase